MKKRKAVLRNSMAVLLSAVMASSLTPAIALANEGEADTSNGGMVAPADGAVVSMNGQTYPSIAAALERAVGGQNATITLEKSFSENVVIPAGKEITLKLNGKTLTNNASNGAKDTITVMQGAKLTINGTGTVDNVSHGKAVIANNGTVTLNGGSYTRSQEAGKNKDDNGGNSYYNIFNHGIMTVNDGVTVVQDGKFSSLFENGYFDYSSQYNEGENEKTPTLTINGGTFSGGLNTIKNDDNGILRIYEGTFKGMSQAAFLNWNVATVEGGTFTLDDTAEQAAAVLLNGGGKPDINKGELTISGGVFKGGKKPVIKSIYANHPEYLDTVNIKGGRFSQNLGRLWDDSVEAKVTINSDGLYGICDHTATGRTYKGAYPATCGNDGYAGDIHCDLPACDEFISRGRTIPATGDHAYGEWAVTEEATEFEPGTQERSCSVCGAKETQETPALGHKPSEAWSSNATDHWKVCEGCGAELEEAPHSFGEWETTKEATELEPGEKARSCSVCGATETEELPALGHAPSEAWQSDADAHWKVCEGCGAELEKAAHAFGEWKTTKEATTEAAGSQERTCSVCGYVQAQEIAKLSPVPEGGSGWVESEDGEWGYVEAGEPVDQGWKEVGGEWYYFEEEAMQTGWAQVEGEWYYLEDSGKMDTGWKEVDGDWYYLEDTGKMATGWQQVDGDWYHLGKSGRMDTGWKKDGGTWYYLNGAGEGAEGSMATGWKKVGGEWYYLNRSGAMRSGWQKLSGTWYLLNAAHDGTFGAMLEGWQRVDAKAGKPTSANSWYYLEPGSGAMAVGRWVGGYYVDASGRWIP